MLAALATVVPATATATTPSATVSSPVGIRTETSVGTGSGEIGEPGGASVTSTNTINFSIAGTTPFIPERD
jgi:hypothetical protein